MPRRIPIFHWERLLEDPPGQNLVTSKVKPQVQVLGVLSA